MEVPNNEVSSLETSVQQERLSQLSHSVVTTKPNDQVENNTDEDNYQTVSSDTTIKV